MEEMLDAQEREALCKVRREQEDDDEVKFEIYARRCRTNISEIY
jgi:hypothetical protein